MNTIDDFSKLRDPETGKKRILEKLKKFEAKSEYLSRWQALSKESDQVYPSQGMLLTPFDDLSVNGFKTLPTKRIIRTLRMRMYFLELFNHPYRVKHLKKTTKKPFVAPQKNESVAMDFAKSTGFSYSIGDLGAATVGSEKARLRRTHRYAEGPFVKLGRQARTYYVGSANPDVWGTSLSIATMAASHCLSGIPRNGVLSDIDRQADLASEIFEILDETGELILKGRRDKGEVLGMWKANVMGVVEPSAKALKRAEALYKKGVRSFRVYSPEPGTGPVDTVKALRKRFGNKIEIFTGQIVDVAQAKRAQEAGADGLYVGIGGGGRCTTGVRSGSAVDWPELVWDMRGEINIPVIVEGGASDHVATTLLLGASGIGVSRIASGGTIESPGGLLYCVGKRGKLFKPYGGEASSRAKYGEGKMLAFGIPAFIEGETTRAVISYAKNAEPTVAYNLHLLIEDAILALVFRGAKDISELQAINPSPLRKVSAIGQGQMHTH